MSWQSPWAAAIPTSGPKSLPHLLSSLLPQEQKLMLGHGWYMPGAAAQEGTHDGMGSEVVPHAQQQVGQAVQQRPVPGAVVEAALKGAPGHAQPAELRRLISQAASTVSAVKLASFSTVLTP